MSDPTSAGQGATGPFAVQPPPPSANGPTVDTATPEGPDWTDQVTDLIVDIVDRVHDRTTGPALTIARGIVYGLVILIVGGLVGGMLLVGLVRALEMLPGDIWIAYMGAGVVFVLLGFLLWTRQRPRTT